MKECCMALKPISIRQMEDQTGDQYEAVVVMSQRAKQVLQDRLVQKMLETAEDTELGVFDEIPDRNPEDYEELDKATTVAVDEFMDGKLNWQDIEE